MRNMSQLRIWCTRDDFSVPWRKRKAVRPALGYRLIWRDGWQDEGEGCGEGRIGVSARPHMCFLCSSYYHSFLWLLNSKMSSRLYVIKEFWRHPQCHFVGQPLRIRTEGTVAIICLGSPVSRMPTSNEAGGWMRLRNVKVQIWICEPHWKIASWRPIESAYRSRGIWSKGKTLPWINYNDDFPALRWSTGILWTLVWGSLVAWRTTKIQLYNAQHGQCGGYPSSMTHRRSGLSFRYIATSASNNYLGDASLNALARCASLASFYGYELQRGECAFGMCCDCVLQTSPVRMLRVLMRFWFFFVQSWCRCVVVAGASLGQSDRTCSRTLRTKLRVFVQVK